MGRFREKETGKEFVGYRVRLDTPVERVLNNEGICRAARLGEMVMKDVADEDPHNPVIMAHEEVMEKFVCLDKDATVDIRANVHGIENYEAESVDEPPALDGLDDPPENEGRGILDRLRRRSGGEEESREG